MVNNSLSALMTWCAVILENPDGGSRVSCPSNCCTHASCSSNLMRAHWSYASPWRWSAHCNCKSVEVSATRGSAGLANFTICCSSESIMGFSLRLFWTSLSLLLHLLGGIHVMQLVSFTWATKSINAYEGCNSPFNRKPGNLVSWSLNLAAFSASGSLRAPSVELSVALDFSSTITMAEASKCKRLRFACKPKLMSTPPLICVEKSLNCSSVGGDCGVPDANARALRLLIPLFTSNVAKLPSVTSLLQCCSKAASESARDMLH